MNRLTDVQLGKVDVICNLYIDLLIDNVPTNVVDAEHELTHIVGCINTVRTCRKITANLPLTDDEYNDYVHCCETTVL